MGKPFIYPFVDKGYSNRHRTYTMPDRSQLTAHITRYTYGYFYKPAQGPRGGKAKKQCARSVYYKAGVFYRAKNIQLVEGGKWVNSLAQIEGNIWDAHPHSSEKQGVPVVKIECIEGIPVSVKTEDGTEVWAWGINPMSELEDLLHIPAQDRAQESIEAPAEPAQVEAEAEAAQELEAARVAWLESTTEQGQQLDLMAYFGFGDASWQELALTA